MDERGFPLEKPPTERTNGGFLSRCLRATALSDNVDIRALIAFAKNGAFNLVAQQIHKN